MDCPFFNNDSCDHVNAAVGELVVLSPSVCSYCVKSEPQVDERAHGYAVQNTIWSQRARRGLEVGPIPTAKSLSQAEQIRLARVKRRTKADLAITAQIATAPVVEDPKERLEICESCDRWSVTNQRCKAACNCANRPRPMDDSGKDCPLKKWKRA